MCSSLPISPHQPSPCLSPCFHDLCRQPPQNAEQIVSAERKERDRRRYYGELPDYSAVTISGEGAMCERNACNLLWMHTMAASLPQPVSRGLGHNLFKLTVFTHNNRMEEKREQKKKKTSHLITTALPYCTTSHAAKRRGHVCKLWVRRNHHRHAFIPRPFFFRHAPVRTQNMGHKPQHKAWTNAVGS